MHAIDTNVLVRLITRDDPRQTATAEQFVDGGAWVSHLVLAETCWVLGSVYEIDGDQLASAIELLLNHRDLAIQDPEVVGAALIQYRNHPSASFTDCLVVEIARKAGHLPLGTFDKALSKVDGAQKL